MTKIDWTAEEVRHAIDYALKPGLKPITIGIVEMLTAFAERIAADESAVPVAYLAENANEAFVFFTNDHESLDAYTADGFSITSLVRGLTQEAEQPHPPAQAAQETPCSLNEALNVIEHWGRRGNTLNGDDVDRFRALADKIAPAQEQPGWKLDKPARVGGTTFGKGVPWETVIGAAQREYERKPLTPEQTAKLREMFPTTPPKEK